MTMPDEELDRGSWLTCVAMAELKAVALRSAVPVAPAEVLLLKTPVENGIWQTSLVAAAVPGVQLIWAVAPAPDRQASNKTGRIRLIIFSSSSISSCGICVSASR